MEIWKDIQGYENMYQVSDLGRIRSLDRVNSLGQNIKGKIRKTRMDNRGYPIVRLSKEGKYKDLPIHRLVAIAFIPNPDNKETVNHIDGDKINWSIGNLEWMTTEENTKHAFNTGLNDKRMKLSKEDIEYIRENYIYGDSEFGCGGLSKKFGVYKSHIARIVKGKARIGNY